MLRSLVTLTLFSLLLSAESAFKNEDLIIYQQNTKAHALKSDLYRLVYTAKDKNCSLYKNANEIPRFDPRFNRAEPRTPYTCATYQKEQYRGCRQTGAKAVSAVLLSFGVYEHTNLLLGFKADYHGLDAYMEVECSKQKMIF